MEGFGVDLAYLYSAKCHLQKSTSGAEDGSTRDHLVNALSCRRHYTSNDQDDRTGKEEVSSTKQI